MKNERAYYAVVDLLTYRDAERTAFSIINHYAVSYTHLDVYKRQTYDGAKMMQDIKRPQMLAA